MMRSCSPSVEWSTSMDVSLLLADPLSENMAAFCCQAGCTDCKIYTFFTGFKAQYAISAAISITRGAKDVVWRLTIIIGQFYIRSRSQFLSDVLSSSTIEGSIPRIPEFTWMDVSCWHEAGVGCPCRPPLCYLCVTVSRIPVASWKNNNNNVGTSNLHAKTGHSITTKTR